MKEEREEREHTHNPHTSKTDEDQAAFPVTVYQQLKVWLANCN